MADENERHQDAVQTYRLHSSQLFIAIALLLGVLSLVPLGLILRWNLQFDQSPILWLLCAGLVFTPVLLWMSAATHLVPGGSGLVHIRPEGVELVTPKLRKRFPIEELQTKVTMHNTRISVAFIPMGTINTDVHVRLDALGVRHTFSRRLFENPDRVYTFIDDLDRIQRGEPPTGIRKDDEQHASGHKDPVTAASDAEYEARLDAEIDAID